MGIIGNIRRPEAHKSFFLCTSIDSRSSLLDLRSLTILCKSTEELLWRYTTHVAGFVEVPRRSRSISFLPAAVSLNEDTGHHQKENSSEGAGQCYEYNEANGKTATYKAVELGFVQQKALVGVETYLGTRN